MTGVVVDTSAWTCRSGRTRRQATENQKIRMRMQNEECGSPLARALPVFSILNSHSNFLIFRRQTTESIRQHERRRGRGHPARCALDRDAILLYRVVPVADAVGERGGSGEEERGEGERARRHILFLRQPAAKRLGVTPTSSRKSRKNLALVPKPAR